MKAILFSSSANSDIPADMAFKNNLAAAAAPTANDDASLGYEAGSQWIYGGAQYVCVDPTVGAAVWKATTDSGTPGQVVAPAATTATGAGGTAKLVGGTGGTTSGNGGPVDVTGGAATAGNGNGGSLVLSGGAKNGTGIDGVVINRSVSLVHQGTPAAKTVSATLTAAEVLAGIVTVNQGAAGASALQLPLAADMDTALPDAAANDAFDFSLINISTVAAEDASITTNTGWTLVGDMDVASNAAATDKSAGRFRARKTAAGAWTLYRLS